MNNKFSSWNRGAFVAAAAAAGVISAVGLSAAQAAEEPVAVLEKPAYILGEAQPAAEGFGAALELEYSALRTQRVNVPERLSKLVPNGGGLGANVDQSRAIETLTGTGYVFPAAKGGVCIAAPGWDAEKKVPVDDWGVACTSNAAASNGVRLAFLNEKGAGVATVLVPAGSTVSKVTAEGTAKSLDADGGVISTELSADERVVLKTVAK